MAGLTLMSIPLEIRHQIFGYASVRDEAPKKVLRRWFEKKEVKELIAQMQINNPGGPTPVASYDVRDPYEEDTDLEEAEAEEIQEQEDEEDDSEDGEQEEVEEEQDEDEENDAEDQVMDGQNDNDDDDDQGEDAETEDEEMDEPPQVQNYGEAMDDTEENQPDAAEAASTAPTIQGQDSSFIHDQITNNTHGVPTQCSDSTSAQIANTTDIVQGQASDLSGAQADESDNENIDPDNEGNEGAASDVADDDHSGDGDVADGADGDDMAIDDGNHTPAVSAIQPPSAVPPPPPPPAPVVRPHHKWRHIPKFLRISQCPPPPELFLTCKELNREAKDWFYDTAVIRIDATGSFQHFTMFEHSLDQIVEAVFSPFESARKVQVKFVWDTEWIRAHSNGLDDVFESLLYMRAGHVIQVLRRAPELREVVVEWHDSINDNLSTTLKHNVLERFTELAEEKLMQDKYITVNMNEYYLEEGKKPHRKSTLGRKRIEFQNFADAGFEFK